MGTGVGCFMSSGGSEQICRQKGVLREVIRVAPDPAELEEH